MWTFHLAFIWFGKCFHSLWLQYVEANKLTPISVLSSKQTPELIGIRRLENKDNNNNNKKNVSKISYYRLETKGLKWSGLVFVKQLWFVFVSCYAKQAIELGSKDCRGRLKFGRYSLMCRASLAKVVSTATWLELSWHQSPLCSVFPAIWY